MRYKFLFCEVAISVDDEPLKKKRHKTFALWRFAENIQCLLCFAFGLLFRRFESYYQLLQFCV